MKPLPALQAPLSRVGELLSLMLGVLNLVAGLMLLLLGTRYLLSMFGLIRIPGPIWIGWFVDHLLGMGMSARSSQAVVWTMTVLGASLIVVSIDYLRVRYLRRGETWET